MHGARLDADAPPSDRELEAARDVSRRACDPRWSLVFPGAGELCLGRTGDGAVLAGLGTLELSAFAAGASTSGLDSPAAGIPLLAYGDLLALSVMDSAFAVERAAQLRFVPQESLSEMALAPFSADVLRRPEVWGGILGTLAAGLAFSQLVEGGFSTQSFGRRPVLFGHEVNSPVGYPLAAGIGAGLFEQVALAEEATFRGVFQSGFARRNGETAGWIYGSLLFGAAHATNALFLAPEDRLRYLLAGVPFLTVLGGYLGQIYRASGYSLLPGIAVHFWYDFLLEATSFVLDPRNSPLALRLALPF